MRRKERPGVELWCHPHFDAVFKSREEGNPINGSAATEFLLRRFAKDIRLSATYKKDLESGMTDPEALYKALVNLVPICCLYKDDIPGLLEFCRIKNLAVTHPEFNNIPEEQARPIDV